MDDRPHICEALRLLRTYHDMNQTELCVKLDVSTAHISMIESGKRIPSIDVLQKYGVVFAVPVSSILFLSEQLAHPPIERPISRTIHRKIIQILNWLADKHEKGSDDDTSS